MSSSKIVSFEKPNVEHLERMMASGHLTHKEEMALKSYADKIDNKTGYVKVDYKVDKFGRHKNEAVRGKTRTTFTGTLMRRTVRNLLFGDAYDDLDIANASGVIMRKVFESNGLRTPKMTYLVENRESVLADLMSSLGVERSTAKDILIEIFFCGSGHKSMYSELNPYESYCLTPFVEELKAEYLKNLEVLVEKKEFTDIRNFCVTNSEKKNKEAWLGTFASVVYQDEERKVIEVIYKDIVEIGKTRKIEHPTGAIIFDGLHTVKELVIRNYIEKIEATVLSKTGYKIKLEIKEMEVEDEVRQKMLGSSLQELSYEARKSEFEKSHFKTRNGGKKMFHTVNSYWNADIPDLVSSDRDTYKIKYEDLFTGSLGFIMSWFLDPEKRSYDDIEYAYVKPENHQKNLYYAFPVLRFTTLSSVSTEEERQSNIDWFRDYCLMLAEDNTDYYEFIIYWIADILQNPDTKGATPVSLLFYGKEGCGKSFLTDLMKALLGDRIVHQTKNPKSNGDILHEFNSLLKYKLFIELQEINLRVMGSLADEMKGFITEHQHRITQKGQDPIMTLAQERVIETTNNRNSMIINKGDRRMCAFEVSNRLLGQTKYWTDAYTNRLKNNNCIKDIADYLLGIDLTGYCFRDKRPITTYYKSLIQFSMPVELDFFREKLFYGNTDLDEFKNDEGGFYEVPTSRLFDYYSLWRKEVYKIKDDQSQKAWSLRMKGFEDYGVKSIHKATSNVFQIHIAQFKKKIFEDFEVEDDEHKPLSA